MTVNFSQARDEILTLFRTAWLADPTAAVIPLFYWDVRHNSPKSDPFARVTVRHTIGNNDGITNRRFTREGIITVQIFTMFGEGLSSSDVLSKVAADAFQGKSTPGGVWFRNVRLNEVGQDGEFFQVNVLADFTYDEEI